MHAPGPHAANRLAHEKSPYLLQHAHNPVDWYPWGEEAFARARAEDRPVFLSIGYSTCHWCHVMERESFMDESVAALLNEHFVCVKVDREERPDVDRIYMTALQALGAGGGWPLNAFLTPALEPFWGGTYFPPDTLHGRAGLRQILPRLVEAWRTRRADVVGTGAQVMRLLHDSVVPPGEALPEVSLAAHCAEFLEREHDEACGGFGGAPKFPSPGNLWFLLRRWARGAEGAETARRMALAQLDAMRAGGLHDQLGGGFHRYSTDREWLVPHFEKMLYDQALIADACLDAFRATGDERWARTARGVFDYVARDLTSPEGAFLSAEDADSEGAEGTFYVWTPSQFEALLGTEAGAECARWLGVSAGGNFEHGASVLHEAAVPADGAAAQRFEAARARLLAARAQRPRPHRDDKVIAAWNGLFIAALANGARALEDVALAERGARAFDFVWTRMGGASGALRRRWRDGEAACDGQLDDHAALALAALELYAATHEPLWLERSLALVEQMVARFLDPERGGFFDAPRVEGLPRLKDGFDGAELAGNSLAAEVLWRLGTLCERDDLVALARRSFDFHAARLARAPWAMPRLVGVMERAARGPRHVVVAGEPDRADTLALLRAFESSLRPDDDLVLVTRATRAALERLTPFAAGLPLHEDRATAYVCVDHACRPPVHGPEELVALLDD